MKRLVFFNFILFIFTLSHGQEIKTYNLDLTIDTELKHIYVKGTLDIDFGKRDSIILVLPKNSIIHEISFNQNSVKYTFNRLSASPIYYIADGGKLSIKNPATPNDIQTIFFSYECDMSEVFGFGKSFTEEWIEIGYYTAWFPVHQNSRQFTSQINISIDEDYKVSGSGIVMRKGSIWEMQQPWPAFDNVILASRELKTMEFHEGDIWIETVYTKFRESDIDSVFLGCKDVLGFYQEIFGLKDSAYVKFVLSPGIGRGGYSRKSFITMKASEYDLYLKKGIAHEMAHFWWSKANTDSWDDWLNESFAEFSMLIYIRERVSKKIYDALIEEYENLITNSPPIWGIDRKSPEAYTALYNKGSLILIEFEKKLGEERFYDFLLILLREKIKTTSDFLDLVEKEISKEMRFWFESKLKG